MQGASCGHRELVLFLLGAGSDPSLRVNTFGETAAAYARNRGHPELAALLEEAYALRERRTRPIGRSPSPPRTARYHNTQTWGVEGEGWGGEVRREMGGEGS